MLPVPDDVFFFLYDLPLFCRGFAGPLAGSLPSIPP